VSTRGTESLQAMPRRIALVHDWLTGMRGGEKVLEVLCERFPHAEIFTLLHVPGSVSPTIERLPIHTSFAQRLPGVGRHYRSYLPFFPFAIERLRLEGFDFVLSTSHCCAKSVIRPQDAVHLCYCFTPMRYAWDQFDAYFGRAQVGILRHLALRPILGWLRSWDRRTAGRPDRYVAISHYVAGRIGRYYNREAEVVYPPVDTAFFTPGISGPEPFALVVSALAPYKRVDVAIRACQIANVPLKIVGTGPERPALERLAGPSTEFLGWLSDEDVRDFYRRASVVLLPGEEDFGIVPLEAQACGRPVVAIARGGALETVVPGETGILVDDVGADALAEGIQRCLRLPYDPRRIRQHAERFSRERFGDTMEALVRETWQTHRASVTAHER
jgi:glycosyltransferase involved in cell wall biosynthesis